MNLDKNGTGDESTLVKRRPNDSEFLDLHAKIDKGGIAEIKTLRNENLGLLPNHSSYGVCRGIVTSDVLA